MIRLSKKSAQILIVSSLCISFILVVTRLDKDAQECQRLQELRENLLRKNLISQMDRTAGLKYTLVEKNKHGYFSSRARKSLLTYEPKSYQEMVDLIRSEKLWFTIIDYRIEVSKKKNAARFILMGRPWSDFERDNKRKDGKTTNKHRIKRYSTVITEDSANTLTGKLSRAGKKKDFTVFWLEEITLPNQENITLNKTTKETPKSDVKTAQKVQMYHIVRTTMATGKKVRLTKKPLTFEEAKRYIDGLALTITQEEDDKYIFQIEEAR